MNQQPITITATRSVWLNEWHTPDELVQLLERGQHDRAVDILCCYGDPSLESFGQGYTRVGEADVTVRLIPRDEQTKLAVQSLNKKLDELRAQYLQAQQEILERIQKLQALPMADVIDIVELGTDPA
jgi:hypothetical protein